MGILRKNAGKSMSSSSSESDEEEKKKLALVVGCYQASTNGKKKKNKKEDDADPRKVISQKKSLREDAENAEPEHIMRTTPEFRNFVSKKLDAYLDKEIEDFKVSSGTSNGSVVDDPGVRLLLKSRTRLNSSTFDVEEEPKVKRRSKRCPSSSSESDDDEDERLKSAAVSSDFVLKDTAVKAHKLSPKE